MEEEREEEMIRKLAEREQKALPIDASEKLKSAKEIMDAADKWETPESKSQDDIWKSLEDKLDSTDDNGVDPRIRKRIVYLRAGIAAVLILGALWVFNFVSSGETVLLTNAGESATFYLPDSSKVVLNASSSLSYRSRKYRNKRKVKLVGEAYFEVRKRESFDVESNGVLISVLGTSFNIYSREKITEVKCITGKVKVQARGSEVELNKGEMITSKDRNLAKQKTTVDTNKAISWTQGKFFFDKTDLRTVIKELEIQFDIEITGQDFSERVYSGYFDNSSQEKALSQVLVPMGYSFTVSDRVVSVK